MGRVKVYDANKEARRYREVFQDKPSRNTYEFNFCWPDTLQHVGDNLAVAYASDKWKKDGESPSLYKHIAESQNDLLVRRGLLSDDRGRSMKTVGPDVDFSKVLMPKHFAILGLFEECCARLHVSGTDNSPEFGDDEDDGVVQIVVPRSYLGGSIMRIGKSRRPFLFCYTEKAGIQLIIVGEELDIERDGIVG